MVFDAEKPTPPQNIAAFLQSAWTRAGLLSSPPFATKYQHYGDHGYLLWTEIVCENFNLNDLVTSEKRFLIETAVGLATVKGSNVTWVLMFEVP